MLGQTKLLSDYCIASNDKICTICLNNELCSGNHPKIKFSNFNKIFLISEYFYILEKM